MEQTGLIDLTELFNSFSNTSKQTLYSPILAFYNISKKIEKNLRFSSLEFIYKNNLSLEQEININEFYSYISEPLNLDDTTSKNVYKCLDYSNKGKISVSDFILVIDSYRDDYMNNLSNSQILEDKKDSENINIQPEVTFDTSNKFNLTDSQLYWINKFLQISDSVGLTPNMIFNISANEKNLREIILDNFKKKLNVVIPSSKISANELNHITESFDFNKKGVISFEDYSEIVEICKIDPIFSTNVDIDGKKNNKREEQQMKKIRMQNKNIHNLPVRGNSRVLANLKNQLFSRLNPNQQNFSEKIFEENKNEEKNCLEKSNNYFVKNNNFNNPENNKELAEKKENHNTNFIKKFIKELDVFENGEWYFIDILEGVEISKNFPLFNLYNLLISKLSPTVQRKTIFNISKLIDEDLDGFVNYGNLMKFLLDYLNHTSIKLSLKEMARSLEIDKNRISTEEFFVKNNIKQNDELNSVNFVQIIMKLFNIPNLIVKKVYYELKQLSKKDSINCKVLSEMINEYREKYYNYSNNIQDKDNQGRRGNNNFIDKNLFDIEMKKFVKFLQKCFSCLKIEFYNQNKIQSSLFKENLIKFINLPQEINLMQYRENFINSLDVNLSLGISLFNEVKGLSNSEKNNKNKNLTIILRDDLINFITSYYDPIIRNFDLEIIINLIEKNFSPLKCCFESIEYNSNGLIVFDLLKILEKYYTRIAKQILLDILKTIDSEKKGIIKFRNINQFLIKNSKNFKFSSDLFFKELSGLIDYTKLPTFEYFLAESKFKNIKEINDFVDYSEHNAFFFEKLKFNFELSDFIFVYLSENNDNLSNRENIHQEGYSFEKLSKNIDFYRQKISSNKKIMEKKFNKIIDNTSQVDKFSISVNKIQIFFDNLKEYKDISLIFNSLEISENLTVSIFELFKILKKNYSKKISGETIFKFIKLLDVEKKGFILYEKFYYILKENSVEISNLGDLHSKYLANLIKKMYKGNFENFINLKNLKTNQFINFDEFKIKFNKEFFKDEILFSSIFDKLKEKKGKFVNFLNLQILVDYLKYQINSTKDPLYNENTNSEDFNPQKTDEELDLYIYNILKKIQNFSENFLEKLNLNEASKMGKINPENITSLLKENFPENFLNIEIKYFLSKFCTVDKFFDLIKFIEWYENKYSEFSFEEIKRKTQENVPSNITQKLFFSKYNIKSYTNLNIFEFTNLSNALFQLTKYEAIYIFSSLLNNENNYVGNEYKVSFDLFFNVFKISEFFLQEKIEVKQKKIDRFTILTLCKFSNFLENLKSKIELFKSYDVDKDGVLSREEFNKLLIICTNNGIQINECQINSILNIADKNSDGIINYIEFIDFINNIRDNYSKNYQPIQDEKIVLDLDIKNFSDISSIKNISIEYDFRKLKENYEFNLKNFSCLENENLNKENLIIFYLQEDFIDNLNKFLFDISEIESNTFDIIPKIKVFEVLSKKEKISNLLSEEITEKLWNFSMEGFVSKIKNKLILEKNLNIKNFISNIIKFRVKVINQKIENKKKISKSPDKIKDNQPTSKNDNNVINNIFKKPLVLDKNNFENKEIKNILLGSFLTSKKKKNKLENNDNTNTENKDSKKNFITQFKKVCGNLSNNEYDYNINPELDYFKRPDGKIIETILNSEEAAIKKCELIFNSIPKDEKFFDTDFGSQPKDMGNLNKFSLYTKGVAPKGQFEPNQIDWYRMDQISPDSDPLFISEGAESKDVIQGSLGDCWFISALSVLATKDHLLRGEFNKSILEDGIIDEEDNLMLSTGVYPPLMHSFRTKSIFCFRFFKDFKWRYVIIDDRLPCRKIIKNQIPKLIYARCRSENEFWVPLIEKAYAKLHKSYEALISGFIDEGLVDLTGLTARKLIINNEETKTPEKCDLLWELLKEYSCVEYTKVKTEKDRLGKVVRSDILKKNNTMMGVSIDAKAVEMEVVYNNQKCGLLARHAYSILDTIEIPKVNSFKARKKSRLLRIRNPWGTKEWKGKWCDESQEIENNKENIMKALDERYKNTDEKIELDEEDGTFLMSFKDFRKIFTNVYVCIDFPDSFIGIRFYDAWTYRESGGLPINNTEKERKAFSKNPQYYIKVKQKTSIQITLLQNDGRLTSSKFPYSDYIRKNCLVLTPVNNKTKLNTFENSTEIEITAVKSYRENTIVKVLNPGQYIISACCLNEGDVGTFCMQFNFEDSFIDNQIDDSNFIKKLKNTVIERLDDSDNRVKYELIREGTIDEVKAVSRKKCEFLFNNFGKMISSNDVNVYNNKSKKIPVVDEDNI